VGEVEPAGVLALEEDHVAGQGQVDAHEDAEPGDEAGGDRLVITGADVAYRLVREVYHWFGISDDGIPYTSVGEDGERAIDPEAIRRLGQP
jgi:hypothetical protein